LGFATGASAKVTSRASFRETELGERHRFIFVTSDSSFAVSITAA
jgi:hypothetical protein